MINTEAFKMLKNRNLFTITALMLMFLILVQTAAQAFVFTTAFIGAATFLASNAAVIIPACTCVVAMAGAAIAIIDVVRRTRGHDPSAITTNVASSLLSGSAQGLMKGVTGVSSMARMTSSNISSNAYSSASALYSDAAATAGNAAKVALAMSNQIESTKDDIANTSLTRQGLDSVIQLSDAQTSYTASLAAGVKAYEAQASGIMLEALINTREKWMNATQTLSQAVMVLKNDIDRGLSAVSNEVGQKIKEAMDTMASVGDTIKNALKKIRYRMDKITSELGSNIKEWIAKKIVPKDVLDRIKREQEAKLRQYKRSETRQQELSFHVPAEDAKTEVFTNMDAGVGSRTGLKAFREYKAAYKEYIQIMRTDPDSEAAQKAKAKYRELYDQVTQGNSSNSAVPVSPAILNALD
jgi:hypothetical protein